MKKLYIQYGSGTEAIDGWLNYDASPTLIIQKIPIIGRVCRPILNCTFDNEIRYGNIVNGLPVQAEGADGVFCSHVLEHLSLEDFHKALDNTFKILKPGGVFRCIVPDLEKYIHDYVKSVSSGITEVKSKAAVAFCQDTGLGMIKKKRGFAGRISEAYGSSHHRWMWDRYSLFQALQDHGFEDIVTFEKGTCDDTMFLLPERDDRFRGSIGVQSRKPYK